MDIISFIEPVYKVEEFLDKCVQSIVGQTYQNSESIIDSMEVIDVKMKPFSIVDVWC